MELAIALERQGEVVAGEEIPHAGQIGEIELDVEVAVDGLVDPEIDAEDRVLVFEVDALVEVVLGENFAIRLQARKCDGVHDRDGDLGIGRSLGEALGGESRPRRHAVAGSDEVAVGEPDPERVGINERRGDGEIRRIGRESLVGQPLRGRHERRLGSDGIAVGPERLKGRRAVEERLYLAVGGRVVETTSAETVPGGGKIGGRIGGEAVAGGGEGACRGGGKALRGREERDWIGGRSQAL